MASLTSDLVLVRQDSPVTLNALPTPSLLVITVTDPAVTTTVTEPAPAAVTVTVTESTPAQAPPQSPVVSSSPAANTDANPKICQQANVDCNGV